MAKEITVEQYIGIPYRFENGPEVLYESTFDIHRDPIN